MQNKLVGHEFLSSLGKKRLRPGGVKGTNFLIKAINEQFKDDIDLLEVSCNRAYSLVYLAKKIKGSLTGIDINPEVIKIAKKNIENNNLSNRVKVYEMNAATMDFNHKKFDVIINEAMLTMFKNKKMFLTEYRKHIKDDGLLLTHDICLINDNDQEFYTNELKDVINLKPYPLSKQQWINVLNDAGFDVVKTFVIDFSLTTFKGLIRDEGLFNMIKIIHNARKKENKQDFKNMRTFFKNNKHQLKAICIVSKPKQTS